MPFRPFAVSVVALSLVGCAGGTWTTTTRGFDGKTTVTSSDPAEQARIDAAEREQEAYAKAIAAAPRRSAQAPIQVAVFEATVADALAQSLDRKQLDESLLRELSADPLLRIVPVRGLPSSATRPGASDEDRIGAALAKGISPDVWIMPHVLRVSAVELGHPVLLLVLMEPDDAPLGRTLASHGLCAELTRSSTRDRDRSHDLASSSDGIATESRSSAHPDAAMPRH